MLLRAQEHVEYQVALRRALEARLLYVLMENFLLFSHGRPAPPAPKSLPQGFPVRPILTQGTNTDAAFGARHAPMLSSRPSAGVAKSVDATDLKLFEHAGGKPPR